MSERITGVDTSALSALRVLYDKAYPFVYIMMEKDNPCPNLGWVDSIWLDNQEELGSALRDRMTDAASLPSGISDSQLGRMMLDTLIQDESTKTLTVELDRAGINRLIRLLRKARDTQYGKDE